jgi:CheY-like chemotaxis protein
VIYDLISKSFDKKIEIQLDLPETVYVMGDHTGLSQVIMNLCTNARDAMPEGGVLRIEARNEGDQALIIISDTGQGMDKEEQERCFDPFYTSKDVDKGTGLGLSTSYGIIQDHKGDIYVYSEPELGTTFKIYLPAGPQKEGRAKVKDSEMVRGKGQKVLIADDDQKMVKPMDEMLTGLGYLVRSVANGKEALIEYESWRPDAILLDRNMPEMDGIICAKKIIEQDPTAKIILISGYEEKGPHGVDPRTKEIIKGYLTKPIDMVKLSVALSQLF